MVDDITKTNIRTLNNKSGKCKRYLQIGLEERRNNQIMQKSNAELNVSRFCTANNHRMQDIVELIYMPKWK